MLYTVYYTDGSFLSYDFTKNDLLDIETSIMKEQPFAFISIGVLGLKDIRSIIEQKEVIEDKGAEPGMTAEEREWYEAHRLAQEIINDDTETDYIGGM